MTVLLGRLALPLATAIVHLALGCQGDPIPMKNAPAQVAARPPEPTIDAPAAGDGRQRTIYVPAYSHLPRGSNSDRVSQLSILLSVRNVDESSTVTLTHVDYFDTTGRRVRRYLEQAQSLRPLETAEFSVETFDEAGGSGANFLVHWEGPEGARPLLTETVMFGHLGAGYVAFTSRGVELERRTPVPDAPTKAAPPAVQP